MDEKTYKKMKSSGALNLVIGVISIVTGLTAGILLVISGSKLLGHKPENLF